jgi:hypothetical protein
VGTQVSCVPIVGFGFNYLERKWTWADVELGRNQLGTPPHSRSITFLVVFVNNWNQAWFLSGPKDQNFQLKINSILVPISG